MSEAIEPNPCAHCGGEARISTQTSGGWVFVKCVVCGAKIETMGEKAVVALWNRRQPTDAAPGEALLHRYRAALMGMVTQHCDISASARDMELVTHDFLSANELAFDLLEQDGLLQHVGQEEYQVQWDTLRARALREESE